jgi:chemotaxis protein CheZ
MSIHDLSTAIAQQLATMKGEKNSISIEDAGKILEKVAGTITSGNSAAEIFLRDEIIKIANHIQTTKNEILALSPNTDATKTIGAAAVQLDAVVKATEEAAHTIMDAADEIQNVVGASSADAALKQQITDITARIYEACNFQDLTGQRIKKVMHALDFTESRIRRLIGLFSSDGTVNPEELAKITPANDGMLDGPQLPGQAPSQADIDAMFSGQK